jgi:chemosensory pili system protein ChpA (sensor histidine kinase/response regulator)
MHRWHGSKSSRRDKTWKLPLFPSAHAECIKMIDQNHPFPANRDSSAVDLGPLSWVVGSLRETFDGVSAQLAEFGSKVEAASGSHLTTLDTTPLRFAAQGLHEAVGVLDLIERPAVAQVVGAMERGVRRFVESPELCTPDAARLIAQAGSSVIDYLTSVLCGHPDHSVGLFPVYREVAELSKLDRAHPADLWHHTWQWLEVDNGASAQAAPLPENAPLFLEGVLQLFRSDGKQGAPELAAHTQKAWQDSTHPRERVFWQQATGFLQILSAQALSFDDPVKRLLSRMAVQYDLLQQGTSEVSERLAHDLLFFVALGTKAGSKDHAESATPVAAAIVRRYGLDLASVCAYDTLIYGNADQAEREQLREALPAFKELWSDVCAGDVHKIDALADQVSRMSHGMETVWPTARQFPDALHAVIRNIQQTEQAPHPDLAMEVATAVLFLEAATQEHRRDDQEFVERTDLLAQRLEAAFNGIQAAPLTDWMEALYARISDRDSLSQIVTESHGTMGEAERILDDFFRHPQKTEQARESIAKLETISGILMMLNCEEASAAVTAMTRQVQQLVEASEQTGSIDDAQSRANVLRLGNSLGALAFMLDMMGYQPDRARTQFHFDAGNQELVRTPSQPDASLAPAGSFSEATPLFSPSPNEALVPALDSLVNAHASGGLSPADAARQLDSVIQQAELAGQPGLARQARQALSGIQTDEDPEALALAISALAPVAAYPADAICDTPIEEEDLRNIFLEEAAEVIDKARTAIGALGANMANTEQLTNLRRAFHTLKGSGRMVGLASFGEAAWEMERLLNGWLADGNPATPALLQLAAAALDALAHWRESIAHHEPSPWHHACFAQSAAALQQQGLFMPLVATPAIASADDQSATPPAQKFAVRDSSGFQSDALFAPEADTRQTDDPETSALPETALFSNNHPEASVFASEDSALPPLPADIPATTQFQDFAATDVTFTFDEQDANDETQPSLLAKIAPQTQTGADKDLPSADPSMPEPPAFTASSLQADEDLQLFASQADPAVPCRDTEPSQPETENDACPAAPDNTPDKARPLSSRSSASAEPNHPSPAQAQAPVSPSLAGILVNIAPQLAVLHDMVEGLHEDEIKRIGDVRIPLALFNTYLNEADTWSRQLAQELGEWALDSHAPVPESSSHLAHSLAGSSAVVGMGGLASMARGIEHALDHIARRTAQPGEADTLLHAAETVRQGLHQFAAGLQRPADMALLEKIAAIVDSLPPQTAGASLRPSAPAHGNGFSSGTEKKTVENPPFSAALTGPTIEKKDSISGPLDPAGSARIDTPSAHATRADTNDAIDPDLFAIFREEAQALMPQLSAVMRQWTARPNNEGARQETMRLLHTLKGGARLAGAMQLGAMTHDMESAISEIGRTGNDSPSRQELESLQVQLDDIDRYFTLLLQGAPPLQLHRMVCRLASTPHSATTRLRHPRLLPVLQKKRRQRQAEPFCRHRTTACSTRCGSARTFSTACWAARVKS